jgi:hypothetical protein
LHFSRFFLCAPGWSASVSHVSCPILYLSFLSLDLIYVSILVFCISYPCPFWILSTFPISVVFCRLTLRLPSGCLFVAKRHMTKQLARLVAGFSSCTRLHACTVYCVLCTLYCVLCTVYCVLCTVYCVLCTVYCVLCTVYCVLCTVLCFVYCVLHPRTHPWFERRHRQLCTQQTNTEQTHQLMNDTAETPKI